MCQPAEHDDVRVRTVWLLQPAAAPRRHVVVERFSMDSPSSEEIRAAAAVLRRISPSDLGSTATSLDADMVELTAAGKQLFGRLILQERFGEKDAVQVVVPFVRTPKLPCRDLPFHTVPFCC